MSPFRPAIGLLRSNTREISARYNVRDNRFGLTLPTGDGAYKVNITVKVASLGQAEVVAEESVDVVTFTIDLPEAAKEAQNQCEAFLAMPNTSGGDVLVREQIRVLLAAADFPGVDRMMIAGRLTDLSAREDMNGHTAVAVEAQQAAVSVLEADPGAQSLALARSVYTLALRLIADGQQVEGIGRAGAAIEAYFEAAGQPGTAVDAVAAGLADVGRLLSGILPPLQQPLFLGQTLRALAVAQREIGRTDQAAGAAQEALNVDLSAVDDSDPMTVTPELTAVAGLLSTVGLTAKAAEAQQTVVDLLRGFTPAEADRLEYLISFAEAQHNLIVRLRDAQDFPPAVALAGPTVAGYRDYATQPGADLARVQRDLADLVKPLLVVGAPGQALDAERAALEILERIVPAAGGALDHEIAVAEAQHNVVARLLDNHLDDEGKQLAAATIRAYVDYAGKPGATVSRAIADLEEFSTHVLAPASLTDLAAQAHQAAVTLGG